MALISCSQNKSGSQTELNISEPAETIDSVVYDLTSRNIRVQYNNDTYQFSTTPWFDSSGVYTISFLVHDARDTVYCKHINSDSILNVVKKNDSHLNGITPTMLEGYTMVGIQPIAWVRGYNSYAVARWIKPNEKDILTRITIKVFHKEHKLRIQTMQFAASEHSS